MNFLFAVLLSTISLFLILLVLVQRGRGGGLTGALGGMGGQSAFGTKAGDTFTRVTIVSATVWILAAILAVKLLGGKGGPLGDADAAPPPMPPSAATVPAGTSGLGTLDNLPTATPPVNTSPAPAGGSAETNPSDSTTPE